MNSKSRNSESLGTFKLSPSEYHRYVMSRTVPELAYGGGDVGRWQAKLRLQLWKMVMGELPATRCALRPKRLWKRNHPLGTIEKMVLRSEPYSDMPVYLCLPANARPPYGFAICLQGHSTGMHVSLAVQRDDETAPLKVEGDRDFALGCMKRGLAALCIEQRSFGQRRELKQKQVSDMGCHDATMQALLLGKTLIGERVFDVDRAIDYLETRDDVDRERIGVMGNSGGGTISLFSAALLPRIKFAMPSCYFCTFCDSIMSIYHCADNYVPGLLKVADMGDILGLFAPKPVVVVAGREDSIFPIRGVRRAFKDLKRIYKANGAEKHCHLVVGEGGHRFYADDAWPVMLREIERLS